MAFGIHRGSVRAEDFKVKVGVGSLGYVSAPADPSDGLADVEFGAIPFMAEIGSDDAAFAKAAPKGFPQTCRFLDGYGVASAVPEYICEFTGSDGVEYSVHQGAAAQKVVALNASTSGPLGLKRGDTLRVVEKKLRRAGSKPSRQLQDDGTTSLVSWLCEGDGIMQQTDFRVDFDSQGRARAIGLNAYLV